MVFSKNQSRLPLLIIMNGHTSTVSNYRLGKMYETTVFGLLRTVIPKGRETIEVRLKTSYESMSL